MGCLRIFIFSMQCQISQLYQILFPTRPFDRSCIHQGGIEFEIQPEPKVFGGLVDRGHPLASWGFRVGRVRHAIPCAQKQLGRERARERHERAMQAERFVGGAFLHRCRQHGIRVVRDPRAEPADVLVLGRGDPGIHVVVARVDARIKTRPDLDDAVLVEHLEEGVDAGRDVRDLEQHDEAGVRVEVRQGVRREIVLHDGEHAMPGTVPVGFGHRHRLEGHASAMLPSGMEKRVGGTVRRGAQTFVGIAFGCAAFGRRGGRRGGFG